MAEEAIPMWIEDSVLHIGAEATAISGSWMGREAVLKKREPRAYRHPSLDRKLTRQRLAACLLYTSPSPRDLSTSRMPSSA